MSDLIKGFGFKIIVVNTKSILYDINYITNNKTIQSVQEKIFFEGQAWNIVNFYLIVNVKIVINIFHNYLQERADHISDIANSALLFYRII